MAGKKENIKALFSNTRSRVIILFTVMLLLFAVIVGVVRFTSSMRTAALSGADLAGAPTGIRSIPGSSNPTAQYASLQASQNQEQAAAAAKQGSSAIPTIIRSQAFGEGVEVIGPQHGQGAAGFETLAREDTGGPQHSLWLQALKDDRCSKSSVDKVVGEGAGIKDLRGACSCVQLKTDGYGLTDLKGVCSCPELKEAGFSAKQLKDLGYAAQPLRECGFDACALRGAEFSAAEMKEGGFSDGELKGSGFSDAEIARATGFPDGITIEAVHQAGCQSGALEGLRTIGVSANAVREVNGCPALALSAAGFSSTDLKNAGFSAAELKHAGLSIVPLKEAGFGARELLNAGFTSAEVQAAGLSKEALKVAEAQLPPGITLEGVKASGCGKEAIQRERLAGVSAALVGDKAGCGFSQLQAAGFSLEELKDLPFTSKTLPTLPVVADALVRVAGCEPTKLHALMLQGATAKQMHDLNACSVDALRMAGFDATELGSAGFTAQQLASVGFSSKQVQKATSIASADLKAADCRAPKLHDLMMQGVSAKQIRDSNGCPADSLKKAGFDAKELVAAGFTMEPLLMAGFSEEQVQSASPFATTDLSTAGCDPKKLHDLMMQGVSAKQIRDGNACPADSLKKAGFDAKELVAAGFTREPLLTAGFSEEQVQSASPLATADLSAAGCDPKNLHAIVLQGGSAKQVYDTNKCPLSALKKGGFDARALISAGFTPQALLDVGFTKQALQQGLPLSVGNIQLAGCDTTKVHELLMQGVSAKQVQAISHCTVDALKQAGFDAAALSLAGVTSQQLSAAGFSPGQIREANPVTQESIQAAGCDTTKVHELLMQGVSAKQVQAISHCTVDALKQAGFDAAALSLAGVTSQQLSAAGFSPGQIREANPVTQESIQAAGCDTTKVHELLMQGVSAKQVHELNGCTPAALKATGFDASELADAGFTAGQLASVGFSKRQVQAVISFPDASFETPFDPVALRTIGCDAKKLHGPLMQGVSAQHIHETLGCTAETLKAAGYDPKALAQAGFTPEQLLGAGVTPEQITAANLNPVGVIAAGRTADCSASSLQAAHQLGVAVSTLRDTLGCGSKSLTEAGYSAIQLKEAGFPLSDLKQAGWPIAALKTMGYSGKAFHAAGYRAEDLKNIGFTLAQLKEAGYLPSELKGLGFDAAQLKAVGYSAATLKEAGVSIEAMQKAGYSEKALQDAGFNEGQLKNAGMSQGASQPGKAASTGSSVAGLGPAPIPPVLSSTVTLPSIGGVKSGSIAALEAKNTQQLQALLKNQQNQAAEQRYQQKIQQRTGAMLGAATQVVQEWKSVSTQTYVGGTAVEKKAELASNRLAGGERADLLSEVTGGPHAATEKAFIKAGDVVFAVLDTSVNTDEPGPILATIVSGKLKGSKLIGSFTLPNRADKMVINFKTLSVPGAPATISISAYAIDPNTARTALATRANHHYLLRYGSLFAATFLEGFGNAFQSANTTITVGGNGGGMTNTTIQNGVGRSTLENAVIGLATLGKNWGQVAQQQFNTPTTVELCSGTGLGVLFTQDLRSL